MGVDRRGGGKPDCFADVADGRGVAVLRRVAADEVEDLLLALGQIHVSSPFGYVGLPNMCS